MDRDEIALMQRAGLCFLGCLVIALLVGSCARITGEAGDVLMEESGPRAMLRKYEWFKDASARLEEKRADLVLYDARIQSLRIPDMDRHDKAALRQAISERLGVAASYNSLAAEYNANMAKVNFRFCNVGDVPAGSEALPREYAPYLDE